MGGAIDHPDYEEESIYLCRVQDRLDQLIANRSEFDPATTLAYPNAEAATWLRANFGSPQSLKLLIPKPYFARIDFCQKGKDTAQRVYLGRESITSADTHHLVVDWRAPIAQLYYQSGWQCSQYQAPQGIVSGDVTLRRRFELSHRIVKGIFDEIPVKVLDDSVIDDKVRDAFSHHETAVADPFLISVLGETRDGTLHDIIETIQAEQDRIIRASKDSILVVQGSAGSGKTTIALHRLAYLLYTYRTTLSVDRVLFFGPNPLFLQSVEAVLPDLGVIGIKHTTFDVWALEWLNRPRDNGQRKANIECEIKPELVETLLDTHGSRHENVENFRRCRLKGSMFMVRVIEAFAEHITQQIADPNTATITVKYTLPKNNPSAQFYGYTHPGAEIALSLTKETISTVMQEHWQPRTLGSVPINLYRAKCITSFIGRLWNQLTVNPEYSDAFRAYGTEIARTRRRHFVEVIRSQVTRSLASWWPELAIGDYYDQLTDNLPSFVDIAVSKMQSGKTKWSSEETALLKKQHELPSSGVDRPKRRRWDREDLPILLLLDVILNGVPQPLLDYVVVDEAQDLSPIQLTTISRMVRNGAMTLVGDVAQGIFSYRGIQSWDEAMRALQPAQVDRIEVTASYRSTYEITSFANQLLRLPIIRARGALQAQPVARHGAAPAMLQFVSSKALTERSVKVAAAAMKFGARTAAIICKSDAACEDFLTHLPLEMRDSVHWIQEGMSSRPDFVALIPAYRAKGLEFDCVVVANADAASYVHKEYDIKLLYLALTRALHELHVFWVGEKTPLLAISTGTTEPAPDVRFHNSSRSVGSVQ